MTQPSDTPESTSLPAGFEVVGQDAELAVTVATELHDVEQRLLDALSCNDELVNSAARYLAEAGGKRVRPLLTIMSSMLGEGTNDSVRQAAVAMEMTHLATLYHDDVMDSAPLRRGAPSAHEVWGNSVAILSGDLILARASQVMSELGSECSAVQARTFERLVIGQLAETVGPAEGQDLREHYLHVISGKTGSLLAAAARLGASLSGCSADVIDSLEQYGEAVGVAFQLADDVIDLTAPSKTSGKTPGTDLRERVPTLPVLLLREISAAGSGADAQRAQEVLTLVDGDLTSDYALAQAVEAISAHPVTEKSWGIAHQWSQRAKHAIEPLPDSTVKAALESFAEAVVDREA